jgi:hypothetical protein
LAEWLPNLTPEDTLDLVSVTPGVDFAKDDILTMALSARGLEGRLKPPRFCLTDPHWQKEYSRNVYLRMDSLNQAFLCHFSQHWPDAKVGITSAESALPVAIPYPKILSALPDGEEVAALTAWTATRSSGGMIRKMADRVAKLNLNKLHRFREAGLEADDVADFLEDLDTMAKCYEPSSLL